MSPKAPLHFFDILQQIGCEKSLNGPASTFFGTMSLLQNSHFSSEVRIFPNFFSTLCEFFRYIRTIMRFTKAGKNEAEVRKQGNPFLLAQKLWVFRLFYVSFAFKKVLIIFEKLCAF